MSVCVCEDVCASCQPSWQRAVTYGTMSSSLCSQTAFGACQQVCALALQRLMAGTYPPHSQRASGNS